MWNKFVRIEEKAQEQLLQVASMPFVKPYVAAMPDTHWGMGATVGSVIPTVGAVMPAAVGVDIGCGMMAFRTNVSSLAAITAVLPNGDGNWLKWVFEAISKAVPHGRTDNGGARDIGSWGDVPADIHEIWEKEFAGRITDELGPLRGSWEISESVFTRHPGALSKNAERQLGTLGTGNHFIEVCTEIDNPESHLWVVIHSGSRGFGNRIGTYFTKLAGDLCKKWSINLPNKDLGYLPAGTSEFDDYLTAVQLAQKFAWTNREIMMRRVLDAIGAGINFEAGPEANPVPAMIHMHHNYASIQGDTILTRKGAVDASLGKWCIIPGSMGAKTYIARGLGSKDSFNSCSHGAGRAMSRTEALKTFSVADHEKATDGVYCDKTRDVLDETPGAYKDIDAVMESQRDLVEPVLKIKQLVCVKGLSD
jgi:tRNA-splicing ligase RtcB